jgi:hypothetical protein
MVDAAAGRRDDVSKPSKLRTNSASVSAASALNPLFAIGWPQHV